MQRAMNREFKKVNAFKSDFNIWEEKPRIIASEEFKYN